MTTTEIMYLSLATVAVALLVILLLLTISARKQRHTSSDSKDELSKSLTELRIELMNTMSKYIVDMAGGIRSEQQLLQNTFADSLRSIDERLRAFSVQNELQLSDMRSSTERRLLSIQEDNRTRLDEMRAIVDEKLQQTLETQIGQSFRIVSERLEQVYKGLGEMQTLAAGVGDLKRVLSNVKTRGTLGEIQLEAILNEFMVKEQYETQFHVKDNFRVDYAIKMPSDDDTYVYLPIDAKFPMESYHALLDAYEAGDKEQVTSLSHELSVRIRNFARDISRKYIDPPRTTDFAIMFLPVEGIYAEVVRSGIMEFLQREYKVSIAGPTTISALLNSLQMGFRTLAIQKHSGEVWKVLGAVKTEFEKFADVLAKAQRQIDAANRDIDTLIGTRMRMMERRLNSVSGVSIDESREILQLASSNVDEVDNG
ncbi:MAG: DNA recombination protein RmuC [Oscillospiraceae bacterium]|nr:DNA recombination protein RmuC [Oscillospiraceae bacterium]